MAALTWRLLPLLLLVAWYTSQSQRYVLVFRSNETLWRHAQAMAPQKPRVMSNYAGALLEAGKVQLAIHAYAAAQQLAKAPHVPVWDAQETHETVDANIRALLQAGVLR